MRRTEERFPVRWGPGPDPHREIGREMSFYRGGIGQWAWIFHRVTGVGVLLFLFIHILDTSLIMLGPAWYNRIILLYRNPVFGVMEIGLFAAVLYHALNGVRIILVDFWMEAVSWHKQIFWVEMTIFALVFIPVAWIMLGHIFR
ncbi:MAG: succinate dehydrogenase, cytochrome b556 subunit [Candidatus Omnitrophica bacterium]|nr:succinate dehydrogenase, cytochrome b556 subunit [Candidatus Omnitrophota bacterium]